ncbi:MAG TPA: hypothetical protein VFD58_32125 [Blastocatellia bacterium]|nr:hypothetical protein [Blastocatellia bacterium]
MNAFLTRLLSSGAESETSDGRVLSDCESERSECSDKSDVTLDCRAIRAAAPVHDISTAEGLLAELHHRGCAVTLEPDGWVRISPMTLLSEAMLNATEDAALVREMKSLLAKREGLPVREQLKWMN